MTAICELLGRQRRGDILVIGDHASNHIPDGMDLGIDQGYLQSHIAWDIGVAGVAALICNQPGFSGILASNSRLVVDLNREANAHSVIPAESDGIALPGNCIGNEERTTRLALHYHPYHAAIAESINTVCPPLLLSLHSFTPQLASADARPRPWQIGILYNEDDRAARIAIPALAAAGLNVGDQLPYSGKLLNATMNRHGENRGIAYLGVEMRQDLVADQPGQARFAKLLTHVCKKIIETLGLADQIE